MAAYFLTHGVEMKDSIDLALSVGKCHQYTLLTDDDVYIRSDGIRMPSIKPAVADARRRVVMVTR